MLGDVLWPVCCSLTVDDGRMRAAVSVKEQLLHALVANFICNMQTTIVPKFLTTAELTSLLHFPVFVVFLSEKYHSSLPLTTQNTG